VVEEVDLLGSNGVAIFYGADREFVHPGLADRDAIISWLDLSDVSLLQGSEKGNYEGSYEGYKEGYYNWLQSRGYTLDREVIERGYVAVMRNSPEGSRNDTLFRLSRETIRCGIPLDGLKDAAADSGLDLDEIDATVSSAEADIELHVSTSVYDRVIVWRDTTESIVPEYARPVVHVLATRAIELNDHSPFFPQDRIVERLAESGISRTQQAVSKTLNALERQWGLIKIVDLGKQPDGRLNPRAYRLCIDGEPISEVLK